MHVKRKELIYWICNIKGFGAVKGRRLLTQMEHIGDIDSLTERDIDSFGLKEKDCAAVKEAYINRAGIGEEYARLAEQKIRFITCEDTEYPRQLLHIQTPPVGLFVKGSLPDPKLPAIAIVGARGCSTYGSDCARYLGEYYGKRGIPVISGMAYGVDAAGQSGALSGGGKSYAVLAGGVDICYPREHIELYMDLQKHGGLLSESLPGTKGIPQLFPLRNRIISGLAHAVIVVEARKKSGTQITVDTALEQGREVYAVPGRINEPLSEGCNMLIRNGASILNHPEVILEDLRTHYPEYSIPTVAAGEEQRFNLTKRQQHVVRMVTCDGSDMETLLLKTGLTVGELTEIVLELELAGVLEQPTKQFYQIRKG